jgi:hypothetical protein
MTAACARLRDYEVVIDSVSTGRKPRRQRYRLEFLRAQEPRQANMFRIEMREGRHEGEEWAIRKDGSIRVRGTDVLGQQFPATLRRKDPRLQDASGVWLWESDFGSLVGRLRAACGSGATCGVLPVRPLELRQGGWPDETGAHRLVIATEGPESPRGKRHELLVSRTTLLPLQHRIYQGSRLVATLTYRHLRVNPGKQLRRFHF